MSSQSTVELEEKLSKLREYLASHGLRNTQQREVILAEFLRLHEHVTIDELCEKVRKIDASIGYATVYRTLKLFTECGIADKRDFGGSSARFESVTGEHHDHMICTQCGKIIEFHNEDIEQLQEQVSQQYKFTMTSHRMELYGLCEKCRDE